MFNSQVNTFPKQRVSGYEKSKAEWYANCIDYVIGAGISYNDRTDTERKINILHGDIPDEFYKKTLNPYNSANEKYTRFPATMRNFDIMNDIVRRYVSEYFKGIHEFVVGANNPDIVLAKNAKLKQEIYQAAMIAFQEEMQKIQQEAAQQQAQGGEAPNPGSQMPDPEEFINNFNQNYIDKESKQGQDLLDYIRAMTDDIVIYLSCFFNYCTLGECYSYADVRNNTIFKEHVPIVEAFPIPNDKFFVEDHDMFARKIMMSYQQIMDTFDDVLTEKDKNFLETYYAHHKGGSTKMLSYDLMFEHYPELCEKFSNEEREMFRKEPIKVSDVNSDLYEVWHVVWRGEARRGIVTYINEIGLEATRVVEEDYKLNPQAGDISVEWEYEPQVYEGYRIGARATAIYPIKARPIAYNRNGKLPYNGIMEILPLMGKFSIVKLITPFQIMRNIMIYHREMVIAKNKMFILLLPESLIASDTEDKIYKMQADGTLIVDDSEDTNSQKMAQIRLLNANMGNYITELTNLINAIKEEAREIVDMNAQRYGEIAQSAGAATTEKAVAQSSMGSVIIIQMFDEFRKKDYNRDLDYAKLAYIDGLDTSYWSETGQRRYLSLDVNSYVNSDYSTTVRNDAKEIDKLQQLRQWAFSAAQNGDLDMALAAIKGDNVTQITSAIEKFTEIKRKHEEEMKQMDQMIQQQQIEQKLQEIQAKGEQDRETLQLKYYYEMQMKYIDVDMSMLGQGDDEAVRSKERLSMMAEDNKRAIEQGKLDLERQKMVADTYNAAADRQVKMHEIDTNLKIAKENKNKYDSKSKK